MDTETTVIDWDGSRDTIFTGKEVEVKELRLCLRRSKSW